MKMIRLYTVVLFLLGFGLGTAAQEKYKLYINGNLSKAEVITQENAVLVPLTLAVDEEVAEWTVSLVRDEASKKVDVKMTAHRRKSRGEKDCGYCGGNGKCAQDYPAGSGTNYQGTSEYYCNGTGKCYKCDGKGNT